MPERNLDEVLEMICKYLRENIDRPLPDSMSANTRLVAELQLDSLEGLQLLAELEDHYGITLGVTLLRGAQTLGDVAQLVLTATNVEKKE
jgi:acyl carrier protein